MASLEEREQLRARLREIGLVDTSVWRILMKGGVRFESWVEEDAEKRKEALRRINAFVQGALCK